VDPTERSAEPHELSALGRRSLRGFERSSQGGAGNIQLTPSGGIRLIPTKVAVTIDTMRKKMPKSISQVLREEISSSGLSLQTLANETGVERASLSRFMRGERTLRLDMASKVAGYFDLELVKRKKK
jgi:ribosome-binding protein aMBF1 (putative translation factor)